MFYSFFSRRYQQTIDFSRPGKYYVFIDWGGRPGTLGQQICRDGALRGATIIYYGDDEECFKKLCRRWWRQFLRKE